jgi:membrane fusion protein (multidrug efflux system)
MAHTTTADSLDVDNPKKGDDASDAAQRTRESKPREEGAGGNESPTANEDGVRDGGKREEGDKKVSKPFKLSKKAISIGVGVVIGIISCGVLYWLHARHFVTTNDAYTTGHVHQVSSRIMGTVIKVEVDDNELVREGQELVRLDPNDNQVALAKAKAGLLQSQAQEQQAQSRIMQAHSQVTNAEAQVAQAAAQVSQSAAQLEKARKDNERFQSIVARDSKAVSKTEVDAAVAAFETAKGAAQAADATLKAAKAQAEGAHASLEAAEAEVAVAKANIAASQAQVADAELQLSYCKIISPATGKISKKTVEEGQRVQPGQALLAVVPDNIWVVANLKETQLERVKVGQRVDIKIDTLPHKIFYGRVDSIQEGSGATFSLLPPDNATGNFTKIVQRVPVKIVFDPDSIAEFRDRILPGQSVEPKIDLESLQDHSREPKRQAREKKQNRAAEAAR